MQVVWLLVDSQSSWTDLWLLDLNIFFEDCQGLLEMIRKSSLTYLFFIDSQEVNMSNRYDICLVKMDFDI